ncbi:MAG: PAS domain-containing protein [Flavobacteriaceae bacterium]|nr:PAS domain-containing protein [Flavobacteriaceae bacterium]
MKSTTPKETIKNLIPALSEKEKQEIQAYYTVYEKYADDFSEKATEDLKDHPVFGKIVRDIPKDISAARNKLSRDLQKDAIINDNWQPYIDYQIGQGITYAKMGLDFKSWYEVIALVRNYMRPLLHKEYENEEKLFSSLSGMNRFLDISMGIIGEAYMQEKEEILLSNEAKLKQAQAIAHMGSWGLDFATGIAIWSEELCRIHGLLPEENKQSFESWLSFIHPEDLEYVKKEVEKSNASLSDTILNHRIMRKDGTVRNIYSVSKFVLNPEGKPIGIYGISHDVTEQKLAEEVIKKQNEELEQKVIERTTQLQKSLKEISDYKYALDESSIVAITDEKGIIKEVNNNFCTISKYTREELIGQDHRILNSGYHTKEFIQDLWVTISSGKIWRGEVKNKAKDGTFYWLDTTIVPFLNDGGIPYQYMTIRSDITQRKDAEDQLQAANKELEAFTYSVSHDLRAPLRAVNGYAQMLNEDYGTKLDEEGKRIIETIRDNALKMGILIDDLLSFSRLGRKEIQMKVIDMNELTKEVLVDINKSIAHSAEIKIGKLHKAKADYGLLRQVMFNLISNAVKYSSKKKNPVVEISSEEKNGEIIFSVKDNGAGFDMRYADKLFGVFQRLHSQDEFEGTGVGLAIVQRIISRHKGRSWAEGKVNEGANFYITLPSSVEYLIRKT